MPINREALGEELQKAMMSFSHTMQANAEHEWIELELTMAQLKVLFHLTYRQMATVGEVATALGVGRPTASVLIDRVVQLGLAERQEDPDDRRRTLVALSDYGRTLVGRLRQGDEARLRGWLACLSDDELLGLVRGVTALSRAAVAETDTLASEPVEKAIND